MKHTPGPWTFISKNALSKRIVTEAEGWPVADTFDRNPEANARLIAAAPEMLEALEVANEIIKMLIPLQKKYGVGIGPREQADLDVIANAIAKAKG